MRRYLIAILWTVLAANIWLLLIHMIINVDAGSLPLSSPEAMLTCALLVAAPALIFLPLGSRIQAPLYEVEAILGWGTLGFVAVFLRPSEQLTYGQFLALLLPLTVALAAVTTAIAYAFVCRLRADDPRPRCALQARRIGYLAALALVALGVLKALALLTPFNGALVVTIAVLAELFVASGRRPLSQGA